MLKPQPDTLGVRWWRARNQAHSELTAARSIPPFALCEVTGTVPSLYDDASIGITQPAGGFRYAINGPLAFPANDPGTPINYGLVTFDTPFWVLCDPANPVASAGVPLGPVVGAWFVSSVGTPLLWVSLGESFPTTEDFSIVMIMPKICVPY